MGNNINVCDMVTIIGPTAVGKTDLSIKLAHKINGEIVSGDSMQVYRHMNIGTAKVTEDEKQNVPHFLIDVLDPHEDFNVFQFKELAIKSIEDIKSRHHIPILVGGSGMYVNGLLYQYTFTPVSQNKSFRDKLESERKLYGENFLYEKLKKADPKACEKIFPKDIQRTIRALEVIEETGKPFSSFDQLHKQYENSKYPNNFIIGLTMPRDLLYEKINMRVDLMISEGLVEEVQQLLKNGVSETSTAMQGIGYKEIIKYLNHQISLNDAINEIKQGSRRYAKRQLTWFRRDPNIIWYDVHEKTTNKIVQEIMETVHFQPSQ